MKILLLVIYSFCLIISCNARLIEKITDRTLTTETKTGSSPAVRLARQAIDDDLFADVSGEDNIRSDEYVHSYSKRENNYRFFKPVPESSRYIRKPRDSNEQQDKTVKAVPVPLPTTPAAHVKQKPKNTLVKKPIPKFHDNGDYDEDFQMKMSKSPVKVIDSGDHEDEDFNLDDYDFDVNHDEFASRGKLLEPRNKASKMLKKVEPKVVMTPEIKVKTKLNIPSPLRPSNKRERSVDSPKKPTEKEDYYDDVISSSTKTTEKARDPDEEINEENEESKELESKLTRRARSPWGVHAFSDKTGDKASFLLSKILSILPMFPEAPNGHDQNGGVNNWKNKNMRH